MDSLGTPTTKQREVYLEAFQGKKWSCPDSAVRCLTVSNSPALHELDLRSAQPGLSITITDCPNLRSIWLPAGTPSSIDIVAAKKPNLMINGPVQRVTGSWQEQTLHVNSSKDEPWETTWLGRLEDFRTANLVILLGRSNLAEVELDLRGIQHLHWLGASHLRTLMFELNTDLKLRCLGVHHASSLCEIYGGNELLRAEVHDCPQMKLINLEAQALHLSGQVGLEQIDIRGPVDLLTVTHNTVSQLNCPRTKELTLNSCPQLETVTAPASCAVSSDRELPANMPNHAANPVTSASIDSAIAKLTLDEGAALYELRQHVRAMHSSVHLADAFELMHRLHALKVPSKWLWDTRLNLALMHRNGAQKNPPAEILDKHRARLLRSWAWRTPELPGEAIYQADLLLCLQWMEVPECKSYFHSVIKGVIADNRSKKHRINAPPHLAVFLQYLLSRTDHETDAVIAMLYCCLDELQKQDSQDNPFLADSEVRERLHACGKALMGKKKAGGYQLANAIWTFLIEHFPKKRFVYHDLELWDTES